MNRSLNTAGTGMVAQQYNLDVISNNLANINTTSFKQQRAEFQDLMYQTFKASGVTTGNSTVNPVSLQVGLGSGFSANAINFGAAMPGKKYTAHNAKEFKEIADLDADMQMFTEMLVRIGNLKKMQ